MAKIVVAGGAGFVGQQVVRELLLTGESPLVIDNCSRGVPENLPRGVRLIEDDVRTADLPVLLKGCEVLYDFAARVYGVRDLYKNAGDLLADNLEMTIALLRGAAQAAVKKYVYVSSSCTYDFEGVKTPHAEWDTGICNTSYGFGKLAGEHLCHWFQRQYGFELKIVRLFNVYGLRDSFSSPHVIPDFLRKAWRVKAGETDTFPILGSGRQTRDMTWLRDAALGILAVADRGHDGEAYNIGTGREITVNGLADICLRAVRVDPETVTFTTEEAPAEDIQKRAANIDKIRLDTGWEPRMRLEDGIQQVADWLLPQFEAGTLAA